MKKELALEYPWLPANDSHEIECELCRGAYPTAEAFRFTLNNVPFSIRHCLHDDLLFLSPQPGEDYSRALYNHPSYFRVPNDMYGLVIDKESGGISARFRVEELEKYGGLPKNFLEIGCGLGYTLEAVQEKGVHAVGVEFSKTSIDACVERGLTAYLAESAEQPIPLEVAVSAPYEVIALYSVLEHVPNPVLFLEKIVPLLKTNGRLVIRVPNMSSNGPWLSLLDHFWHFTQKSLTSLLERQGLRILDVFSSGAFVSPVDGTRLESVTMITTSNI